MAKKRISEEQAKAIVKQVEGGAKPAVLAKKHGFSLGTYYNWRAKFGSGAKPKAAKKKAAPKKAAKKAAPKAAAPKAAKKAPAKRRGRKPGRKPARRRATKKATPAARATGGAAGIKMKIQGLQAQIKTAQAKIEVLKKEYADAIFG